MIRQDPILIAAPPRSGTTLLAGLFHYHGVWVGRARTTQFPGTNSDFGSENLDIKNIMKREAERVKYVNWEIPFPDPRLDRIIKSEIEEFVPEDTPWLVKTSWCLLFWKFWRGAYPNARWVFPTRDTLKIVDSMNRHPGMRKRRDGVKRQYVANLLRRASDVIDSGANYTFVDMEGLADRDPAVIGDLFRFLDITPDYTVIKNWIKPEMLKR
jgi:hypothetical protein